MVVSLKVGDSVSVPGAMHGTLKYLGPVHGKKGVFAGVQLAPEFAARGKNSGDVEGKHYFRTSLPGSGIFLPAEKAEKRNSLENGIATPSYPSTAGGFSQGGRVSVTGGSIPKPNFSQSIGPGSLVPAPATGLRAPSPALKQPIRRESLPRPTSPLRKPPTNATQTPAAGRLATPKTRPSLGFSRSTIGAPGTVTTGLRSPSQAVSSKAVAPSRFGQSLGHSVRGVATPGRLKAPGAPRSEASTVGTNDTPLSPESAFDEEEGIPNQSPEQSADSTPTPAVGRNFKTTAADAGEIRRLKEQLAERDRQLEEQASSITEMEKSLVELHQVMAKNGATQMNALSEEEEGALPKDVQALRATIREKNENIKALTAEFDNNRIDFRSTLDALEMASSETERVYEKRIEGLLEELRGYQERNDDVESVARQFRQLEELVQELEEGLEESRRGEAEARGEVEFLRGEVERGRSEMRRERELKRAGDRLNGIEPDGAGVSAEDFEELQIKLDHRDDEIRGLKAIIQNMNDSAASRSPDANKTPRPNGYGHKHSKTKSTNTVVSTHSESAENLQQQFRDLENLLDSGNFSEADLREEVQKLRKSVQFGASGTKFQIPGLGINNLRKNGDPQKHLSTATSSTNSTARPGSMKSNQSGNSTSRYQPMHRRKDTGIPEYNDAPQSPLREEFEDAQTGPLPETRGSKSAANDAASISGKTDVSSNAAGWCEICEEAGHDILTCNNMGFSADQTKMIAQTQLSKPAVDADSLRPLSGKDTKKESLRRSKENPHPPPETSVPPPPIQDRDIERPAPLTMPQRHNSGTAASSPTLHEELPRSSSLNPPTVPTTVARPGVVKSSLIEGTGDQAGMLAGKESGIIDASKWCALCERDGHDSVDCPIEDAF